jgi:multidrug efflux pump subunit AcrA (membrane-fusion protein)
MKNSFLRPVARAVAAYASLGIACLIPSWAADGVPVTVSPAISQDVPVYAAGLGTVTALNSALIRARVDGTLESVAFTEGQDVKKGDLLAVIDPRPDRQTRPG